MAGCYPCLGANSFVPAAIPVGVLTMLLLTQHNCFPFCNFVSLHEGYLYMKGKVLYL